LPIARQWPRLVPDLIASGNPDPHFPVLTAPQPFIESTELLVRRTAHGYRWRRNPLLFGKTPRERWIDVDDELRAELAERLGRLGYDGELERALGAWSGTENLEERVDGVEQIDPVVLAELRRS